MFGVAAGLCGRRCPSCVDDCLGDVVSAAGVGEFAVVVPACAVRVYASQSGDGAVRSDDFGELFEVGHWLSLVSG